MSVPECAEQVEGTISIPPDKDCKFHGKNSLHTTVFSVKKLYPLTRDTSIHFLERVSMLKIDTIRNHERMSTQDLLLMIEAAVRYGDTDFDIFASGQHDIGGPLWQISCHKRRSARWLDVFAEYGNYR